MNANTEDLSPLIGVTTATITMVLLKKGLRNVWLRRARPLQPGQGRVVGRAFTMRFIPMREDLATPDSLASGHSTRVAIEDMPPGSVVVVDTMGCPDAGVFGDILCARMKVRGVAAVVMDGMMRDVAGVLGAGLPVWCQGVAAPPSIAGLTFAGWQETIGCGGVAIVPGDVMVTDDDGAVVIPQALVGHVIEHAPKQERLEAWIMQEVEKGVPLLGLYPADAETLARYQATLNA
jgi:regulator of RNase E activity RraA